MLFFFSTTLCNLASVLLMLSRCVLMISLLFGRLRPLAPIVQMNVGGVVLDLALDKPV